jgi:hypothetical protein
MQTMPGTTCRLGRHTIDIGEPQVIASREDNPDGGTFVYPRAFRTDGTLFLNWHFDRDVLDPALPDEPNGRMSRDGGRTWEPQTTVMPPGHKVATGPGETASFWESFAVPESPGYYRVVTWRSTDNSRTWSGPQWVEVRYPGTRGLDLYDPPEGYKRHSSVYKRNHQRQTPPPYLRKYLELAGTRKRGPGLWPRLIVGADTIYSLVCREFYLPGGDGSMDEEEFWNRLDWSRRAIMMQVSEDGGRTWEYRGVVAFDAEHTVSDFDEGECFFEPALARFPDGEMLCVMRVGSFKPLYSAGSRDGGRTWTEPEPMPIRGIRPRLVRLPNGLLALSTGRPDCTLHFSTDRGRTWPLSVVLFEVGEKGPGHLAYQDSVPRRYTLSTGNTVLLPVDENELLYIHDACRRDPDAPHPWLRNHGWGRIVGRRIRVSE